MRMSYGRGCHTSWSLKQPINSRWPKQLMSLTAALPLCHVTIYTTPPPLSLHVHIIISPVRYFLAYSCALSCRVSHACTASLYRAPWCRSGGSCQLLQEHSVCLVWFAGFKVSCPLLALFLHDFFFQIGLFLRSTVLLEFLENILKFGVWIIL